MTIAFTVQNRKQSKTMSVLVDIIQANVCYCCRWKIQDMAYEHVGLFQLLYY